MTEHSDDKTLTHVEIASTRSALNMLRSQVRSGPVDKDAVTRQIDSVLNLLERLDAPAKKEPVGKATNGHFEALYNVSRMLGSSLDLQVVLDQVMDAIIQLTGAERGFLMLRDDDGGLTVKAARNLDQQSLTDDQFKYSRTVAHRVLDSGGPVLTTNAAEDPRFAGRASIVAQSLRSIMATPLRARGSVIGVVYVDSRATAGLFDDEDLAALDAFSGQAAIALDNARLFNETDQELSRRVEQLQQLRRIDLLLAQTLDADEAIDYTLEWACKLAKATGGHLGLVDSETDRIRADHHHGENPTDADYLDEVYPEVRRVLQRGRAMASEVDKDPVLITPIYREHDIIGAVVLRRSGTPFTDEEQDLVSRVVTRAAVTLENARLYAAVRAADKAKSEFVGVVAHDLKTPMTSISGYAQLAMVLGGLSDQQTEFMQKVRDTVGRMERLVSDLADISRIESGHFFMEETRVSVAEVVQAVKDGIMPQIEAKGHSYIEGMEPDLPDMQVDYYRLLQVLTNLVSNASKYTPDGGTVSMNVRQHSGRVEFSVKDTGIGLSPEGIARLGTKFWRAQDDFTRSQPGTGLGFSIASRLVEQMGSQIAIESTEGEGSTFTFSVATARG